MAFPTPPTKLTCPKCGWFKIQSSQSDVRFKEPITKCPKCGYAHIEPIPIKNPLVKLLADVFGAKG